MRIYIYNNNSIFQLVWHPEKRPQEPTIYVGKLWEKCYWEYTCGDLFLGWQTTRKITSIHILCIYKCKYIYICVCHVLLEFTRRHEHKDPCFLNLVDQQYRNSCLLWWGQQKFTVGIPTYLIYSFRIGMAC